MACANAVASAILKMVIMEKLAPALLAAYMRALGSLSLTPADIRAVSSGRGHTASDHNASHVEQDLCHNEYYSCCN